MAGPPGFQHRLRDSSPSSGTACLFAQLLSGTLKQSNEWKALAEGIASSTARAKENAVSLIRRMLRK